MDKESEVNDVTGIQETWLTKGMGVEDIRRNIIDMQDLMEKDKKAMNLGLILIGVGVLATLCTLLMAKVLFPSTEKLSIAILMIACEAFGGLTLFAYHCAQLSMDKGTYNVYNSTLQSRISSQEGISTELKGKTYVHKER